MAESSVARRSLLESIPHDRRSISQDRLNITEKVRCNLLPWNGQFSPQLVHVLLETYGKQDEAVLDPFMGSGTVLVESGALGRSVFGAEINPAACKMAQVYTFVNVLPECRRELLATVSDILHDAFSEMPLFCRREHSDDLETKEKLLALWRQEDSNSPAGKLLETLIVLLNFHKPGLTPRKILTSWRDLCRMVEELPFSTEPVELANCDARQLPLGAATVDLVVTSPPYINVFNYHQQFRASVESLGWDLLHVARSEIGSNRKNRGNRFLTVIQYCLDICQAMDEMRRVCKRSARMIMVVGRESNVLRTRFLNGEIVTRLGVQYAGMIAECRQERVFKNRFGAQIYEDIIHFRPGAISTVNTKPSEIASEVLKEALHYAPQESLPDLEDAIARLPDVKPSAMYRPSTTTYEQERK